MNFVYFENKNAYQNTIFYKMNYEFAPEVQFFYFHSII